MHILQKNSTLIKMWMYWYFLPMLLLLPFAIIVTGAGLLICECYFYRFFFFWIHINIYNGGDVNIFLCADIPYLVWYSVLSAVRDINISILDATSNDANTTTGSSSYPKQQVTPNNRPTAPMPTSTLPVYPHVSPSSPYNPHPMPYVVHAHAPGPYIIHQWTEIFPVEVNFTIKIWPRRRIFYVFFFDFIGN